MRCSACGASGTGRWTLTEFSRSARQGFRSMQGADQAIGHPRRESKCRDESAAISHHQGDLATDRQRPATAVGASPARGTGRPARKRGPAGRCARIACAAAGQGPVACGVVQHGDSKALRSDVAEAPSLGAGKWTARLRPGIRSNIHSNIHSIIRSNGPKQRVTECQGPASALQILPQRRRLRHSHHYEQV